MARRFAEEGAKVVVGDLDEEAARKIADEIGGDAIAVQQDVGDPAPVEKSVAFALDKFGRLDVAVNNAGIGGGNTRLADYSLEDWDKVIAVNLSGVFYGMKYQIPAMLRSGGGAIVNIASIMGSVAARDIAGYNAAKHGVVGLTKTAALEYATDGIRVNAVGPGYVDTPMLQMLEKPVYDGLVGLHPIGRLGRPEEIAELAVFLASDRASFITGSYHLADGGYTAQ